MKNMKNLLGKKQLLLIAAILILAAALLVGVTVAFLQADTAKVSNQVGPGEPPEPTVLETFNPGDTVKKDVKVKLSNETNEKGAYFIRAAVVISLQDADGNTVAKVPVEGTDYEITMGKDWTKNGNYWYYNGTVLPGGTTTNLINVCTSLNTEYQLCVDIVAQNIQANPTTAASTEWGYVPTAK